MGGLFTYLLRPHARTGTDTAQVLQSTPTSVEKEHTPVSPHTSSKDETSTFLRRPRQILFQKKGKLRRKAAAGVSK